MKVTYTKEERVDPSFIFFLWSLISFGQVILFIACVSIYAAGEHESYINAPKRHFPVSITIGLHPPILNDIYSCPLEFGLNVISSILKQPSLLNKYVF